jgi:hypothetical protein
MKDYAGQQGEGCFIPMGIKTLAVWIDNQGRQVLNIPYFAFSAQSDLIQGIPSRPSA